VNTTADILANRSSLPRNPRNQEIETILDPRNPRKTQAETNRIVAYLIDKFHSPEYHNFFCRTAWALNDAAIHMLVEKAMTARVPRAYFISSVKSHPSYIRRYVIEPREAKAHAAQSSTRNVNRPDSYV
jgi:hypothetical protein